MSYSGPCQFVANGRFKLLKEPLSKVSAEVVLLKYDAVKVWLNKVQYRSSLYYCTAQRI